MPGIRVLGDGSSGHAGPPFLIERQTGRKFWSVRLQGSGIVVHYGKIGTKGQVQEKNYPDPARAEREMAKLIREKLGKGYTESPEST